jgi:hypothetical protein
MVYGPLESEIPELGVIADRLKDTFYYSNAVKAHNLQYDARTPKTYLADLGSALNTMINPNLDAGFPVILGIQGPDGRHTVLADGYGYQYSTPYHHLNMGLSESDDIWYNLPSVDSSVPFNTIVNCIYNVFPNRTGEIISGRVLNRGWPVPNAEVRTVIERASCSATGRPGGMCLISTEEISDITDENGIFALVGIPSNYACTIAVQAIGVFVSPPYESQTVITGQSTDGTDICGNVWGIDFYPGG